MSLAFTLLFVIWLLVTVVLNKSFTSLLLNTYYNDKSKPVVKSLEDIRKHKELLISGKEKYFMIMIKVFKFDIGDLYERLNQDKDNFPDPIYSYKIAEKVINSRSVFIGNSFHIENFLMQNKYYHDKFAIGNRYFQQFMLFYVNKHLSFSNEVYY